MHPLFSTRVSKVARHLEHICKFRDTLNPIKHLEDHTSVVSLPTSMWRFRLWGDTPLIRVSMLPTGQGCYCGLAVRSAVRARTTSDAIATSRSACSTLPSARWIGSLWRSVSSLVSSASIACFMVYLGLVVSYVCAIQRPCKDQMIAKVSCLLWSICFSI